MANELQYIHWRLWGLCHYLCMRLCFTKERHRNNDVSKSSAKHQHIPCSSVKCQTMSIVIVYTHSHYKNTVWFVICPQEGTLRSTRAHIHPNSIFIHFFQLQRFFYFIFFNNAHKFPIMPWIFWKHTENFFFNWSLIFINATMCVLGSKV